MGLLGWKAAWLNGSFVICKQAMIMLRAGQHNFVWQVWLWTPTHLKQGRVHTCIFVVNPYLETFHNMVLAVLDV